MRFTYLLILGGCILATLPLEFLLHTGVYERRGRLLWTVVPVVVAFGLWDVLAVHAGWWTYSSRYIVGVRLPGRLPLEELLFFVVVPTCAVLSFEAVKSRKPQWFDWRDR